MSRVSGTVPNLISGISQQAPSLRLASQAAAQDNALASVVDGLDKRPGSEHVAKLTGPVADTAHVHIINRDEAEKYVVTIAGGDLFVNALDGTPRTVNFPHGKGYLAGTDFAAVSIADFTFVVNRSSTVALSGDVFPAVLAPSALIVVRGGNFNTDYALTLVTGSTPLGLVVSTGSTGNIRTEYIAGQFVSQINAAGYGYYSYQIGSTIHVYRTDALPFAVSVTDSYADNLLQAITDTVQSAATLPLRGPNGYSIEVQGSPGNPFDNYHVRYSTTGANSSGIWKEIPKIGRRFRYDATTMPHLLVREAGGTFTFRRADWAECGAGDEKTCPAAGIVGEKITDIFFYRNRLGMIGGEQVVFSRSGEFFNFWRATATQLLDTDPVDVAVSHVKVSILKRAVPFNEALLLFTDQTQFIIPPSEALTPSTVAISQATEFEASLAARPVGLGPSVFFAAPRGGFTSVREYFLDSTSRSANSNDITAHVPRYLEGEVVDMAASPSENALVVLTKTRRNMMWVYRFVNAGEERVTSGWNRWVFSPSDVILAAEFIQSKLYVAVLRSDGLYLDRIDLAPGKTIGTLPCFPKLDRGLLASAGTGAVTNADGTVTFDLPFVEAGEMQAVAVQPYGTVKAGELVPLTRPTSTKVTLPAGADLSKIYLGRIFAMRHTFSPFFVRNEATGGGVVAVQDGRLQIGTIKLAYTDSAYFRTEITPFRRNTYKQTFTGRVLGSGKNVLGSLSLESGSFSASVRSSSVDLNITIVNDSPWPGRILTAEWSGLYTPTTRRMD